MNLWLAPLLQVLIGTQGSQIKESAVSLSPEPREKHDSRLSSEQHATYASTHFAVDSTGVTRLSPEPHENYGTSHLSTDSDGKSQVAAHSSVGVLRSENEPQVAPRKKKQQLEQVSLATFAAEKTSVGMKTVPQTSEPVPGSPSSIDVSPKERRGRFAGGLGISGIFLLLSGYIFIKIAVAHANAPKEPQSPEHVLGGTTTFLAACMMGTVNNNAYGMVMSASQRLASIYSEEDLVALFPSMMLGACLTMTILNGAFFVQIQFRKRILTLMITLSISYVMLGVATQISSRVGFMISLLGAMGIGASTSLGELCCLSFLRSFPPVALGGWGAGTGLAGILGGAMYLGLESLGFSLSHIFFFMAPTGLLYWWAFEYLDNKLQTSRTLFAGADDPPAEDASSPLTWERLIKVWNTSSGILFVLVSVYFLEYTIYPGLVDRDTLCPSGTSWLGRHAFTLGWIAYNFGVMLARGSISFFRIERLWILVLLQLVNCSLWFLEATDHELIRFFGSQWGYVVLIMWIILVGIMGGCAYANCMHAYMTNESIPNDLRELSITVGFALSNVGILLATSSSGVLDNTILSEKALFPTGC